jgi:hypothetical protein
LIPPVALDLRVGTLTERFQQVWGGTVERSFELALAQLAELADQLHAPRPVSRGQIGIADALGERALLGLQPVDVLGERSRELLGLLASLPLIVRISSPSARYARRLLRDQLGFVAAAGEAVPSLAPMLTWTV